MPTRQQPRRSALEALARESRTLIFYEAPHWVLATLEDMAACFGDDREAVLAKELTKTHETLIHTPLGELVEKDRADPNQQRGEIVLVVRGAQAQADSAEQERLLRILMAEVPLKQAAIAAKITGGSKNALYQQGLILKGH